MTRGLLAVAGACALLAAAGAVAPEDDTFDGTELNETRWNKNVNLQPLHYNIADGLLSIETVNGDIDGPNPNYPNAIENLILQTPRAGDWTVETKLKAPLAMQFQLAGLMLYADDNHYVKYDVVADNPSTAASDLRVELRYEDGGALTGPTGVDDPDPPASPDNIWWLRLTKRGDTYSGAISADGTTWAATPGTVTVALTNPAIGLMAVGPDQTAPTTVDFDHFRYVDEAAPTTTATLDPAQPGAGGTYAAPVRVSLSATDTGGSGLASTEYRVDGAAFTPYQAPFTVSENGAHTVQYRSKDAEGNVEAEKSIAFTIARPSTPPLGGSDTPAAPSFRLASLPKTTLAKFARSGLKVSVNCTGPMEGSAALKVAQSARRKLKLKSGTLARRSLKCATAGSKSVTLKPSAKVGKALKKAKGAVKTTVELKLKAAGQPAKTVRRGLTLGR